MESQDNNPKDHGNDEDQEKTEVLSDNATSGESNKPQESAETRLLYMQAEFDNFRKRLLRDQESSIRFANERIVRDLLPLVALFDRALGAAVPLASITEKQSEIKNFVTGIEMTRKEMITLLERHGAELLGKKGEKFNPERHEAITEVPAPGVEPGTIVDIMEPGCLLHGRLLQPAKVILAKAEKG